MKPSILIIADFPNWAYSAIQDFIKESLSNDFDIYIDFLCFNTKKKSKHPIRRIKSIYNHKKYARLKNDSTYDIVFYLAFYFDEYMNVKWKADKIIKGIYTDGFPPSNSNFSGTKEDFINRFFTDADAIVCGSQLIKDFYINLFPKVYYANSILDSELFKRKTINSQKDKFIVGWTGNPKRDFKGYYTHILPAVKLAKEKYPDIQFKSRFSGPMETLPLFYEDIDVVVIASDADAGPFLFAEASLMDIPCISTDVGWPNEVIQDQVNGFIVRKNIEEIAMKIEFLYVNKVLLNSMKERIRNDFKAVFNREKMVQKWKQLFNEVLKY